MASEKFKTLTAKKLALYSTENDILIPAQTDTSIKIESKTTEMDFLDVESSITVHQGYSWSGEVNGVLSEADDALDEEGIANKLKVLIDSAMKGTELDIFFEIAGQKATGKVIITSTEFAGTAGDNATFKIPFAGTGALEII